MLILILLISINNYQKLKDLREDVSVNIKVDHFNSLCE